MAIFGDYTYKVGNKTMTHTASTADEIMNYSCGVLFLIAVVIGVLVNSCLILYYRKNRSTWTHTCYFMLAIAYLVYDMIRGVPTTIRLLGPRIPSNVTASSTFGKFLETLTILCYIDGAVITSVVALIVMVQYKNIHHPGSTLIHGPTRFRKRAIMVMGFLYLVNFTAGIVVLAIYLKIDGTSIPESIWHVYKLLFEVPLLLITAVAPCVYVVNRIKFRPLEQQLDADVRRMVRRDFKLVHIMVVWNGVWFVVTITYLVLEFFDKSSFRNTPESRYIAFVCRKMEPLIQATFLACAILFNERVLRNYVLSRAIRLGFRGMDDSAGIN